MTDLTKVTKPMVASDVPMGAFKNKIINGNFDIWQRGVSFPAITSALRIADRFQNFNTSSAVLTYSRDADVPDQASNYSVKVECTTADAVVGSTDSVRIRQIIEGYNFKSLMGKTAILSFWVKATKTGIYGVTFKSGSNERTYVAEYTINTPNTWEKKEVPITFSDSGGTWDYTNGGGVKIEWVLMCGSAYQTAPNVWQPADFYGSANQVNACDNIGNTFFLSQIQLEVGQVATDFEHRSIGQELAMCQRYFEKSYDLGDAPGTSVSAGQIHEEPTRNHANYSNGWRYAVLKRSTPTVLLYNYSTGVSGNIENAGNKVAIAAMSGMSGAGRINITAGVISVATGWHWTADAEL